MSKLCVTLGTLLCTGSLLSSLPAVSTDLNGISGPVEELNVRPGDNITLYCDCQISTGVYIVWFRNCSHENQPPLIMSMLVKYFTNRGTNGYGDIQHPLPRFKLDRNQPNNTWDLLIENVTESDLGLYYCGTEKIENRVEGEHVKQNTFYKYGKVIHQISFETVKTSMDPDCLCEEDCALSWILLVLPRSMTVVLLPCAYWVGTIRGSGKRK